MIGKQLEEAGWKQGSLIKQQDVSTLLEAVGRSYEDGLVLLLASQSCDIANNCIESDPYVELSVARRIENQNGNLTYNKHPRMLHTSITVRTGDVKVSTEEFIELKAYEKFSIPKGRLIALQPDQNRILEDRQLAGYVAWLAARYDRPALPTAFNARIKKADPKGKLRAKVKKGSMQLAGLYVEIAPNAEIDEDERYNVNLLGVLLADFTGDDSQAKSVVEAYAEVMRKAGMDVTCALKKEDQISMAMIRRFRRFYYDDLSFKHGDPLPPEVEGIL